MTQEEKINIAELLKGCPKGMELDCTMIDNVVFEKLDVRSSHHPIIIRRTDSKDSNTTIHLTKYGQYSDEEDYKCIIFPKGKTTWEGFVPPCNFEDGDVVVDDMDSKKYSTATIKYIQENGSRDIELIIPYNQEIVNIDGRYILRNKKPTYPKTYEECCEVLGADPSRIIVPSNCQDMTHEENKLCSVMYYIYQLLTCRNAYWKIAGEQICGNGTLKHCIIVESGITLKTKTCSTHFRLVFPTQEMRDEFYNNFKDLIKKCKESLNSLSLSINDRKGN